EPAVAIDVTDDHLRAARELEPARDQVWRPIRIVESEEVVVAAHDDVRPAVTVDVAHAGTLGDLPEDAGVDVMPDELRHGRCSRKDGSCRQGSTERRR